MENDRCLARRPPAASQRPRRPRPSGPPEHEKPAGNQALGECRGFRVIAGVTTHQCHRAASLCRVSWADVSCPCVLSNAGHGHLEPWGGRRKGDWRGASEAHSNLQEPTRGNGRLETIFLGARELLQRKEKVMPLL